MKKNIFFGPLVLFLTLVLAGPLFAPNDGCTPGWWKNHTDLWPAEYNENDPISGLFDLSCLPGLDNMTLLQTLQIGDRNLVKWPKEIRKEYKAAKQLLMHAVAGVLNWEHPRVHYYGIRFFGWTYNPPYTPPLQDLIVYVNEALCSGNPEMMESVKDQLDEWNNRICPPKDVW